MEVPMKTKTNFTSWTDQELTEWTENFSFHSFLKINNANTYVQALQELENRKGDIVDI